MVRFMQGAGPFEAIADALSVLAMFYDLNIAVKCSRSWAKVAHNSVVQSVH